MIAADGQRLRVGERLWNLAGEFVHAHVRQTSGRTGARDDVEATRPFKDQLASRHGWRPSGTFDRAAAAHSAEIAPARHSVRRTDVRCIRRCDDHRCPTAISSTCCDAPRHPRGGAGPGSGRRRRRTGSRPRRSPAHKAAASRACPARSTRAPRRSTDVRLVKQVQRERPRARHAGVQQHREIADLLRDLVRDHCDAGDDAQGARRSGTPRRSARRRARCGCASPIEHQRPPKPRSRVFDDGVSGACVRRSSMCSAARAPASPARRRQPMPPTQRESDDGERCSAPAPSMRVRQQLEQRRAEQRAGGEADEMRQAPRRARRSGTQQEERLQRARSARRRASVKTRIQARADIGDARRRYCST